ncbi:Endoglucanase E-4-like 1 [Homarus americanus]|uniref:Endoglucanase n=1 Tax=Homarus americanus TaxID=6706 RepID=A0A8J5JY12_HOMAM|nr:Endoglucanase E-4-like 1 [Homarus americanus]
MTGVLVKTCLLGALALTLLQTAEAQCPEVVITNEWDGNYQADFIVEAPADSNGISLDLTFSSPVDSIEFWAGSVTKTDDTHFTLVDSKTDVHEGDQIKFSFQVHFSASKPYVITEVLNGLEICDTIYTTPAPPSTPEPLANPCDATDMKPYDYSQVLCMSYVFYEAQRSGPLPADQRVTWRGDSALDDGSDVGHDLTGGYYDAGDFVKFGFPMAYTATVLGWGLIDFAEGHEAAGQLEYGQAALKWATDYFLKANTGKNEFYGQKWAEPGTHAITLALCFRLAPVRRTMPIGDDLRTWTWNDQPGRSTKLPQENDPDYSAEVLDVAKELYDFADKFRLTYDKSIPDASAYYHSWSGFGDELCWAALWLARATGEDTYLTRARGHWEEFHLGKDAVLQFSWDDKRAGVFELFWLLDGSQEYLDALNKYLDWLKDGATYTPEGLAAKNGINTEANREWAAGQVDQLLGANSRLKMSFVVGYGDKYPERPHHRSSSCPWPPKVCDYTWAYSQDGPNPHVLYGALVGGPSQNGDYKDDREDFTHNEVACDYNAAFSGALAAMVELN